MAFRSASPNPSRPSIHSTRTPEANRRHSSPDPNLSGSLRGRDAVCSSPSKPSSSSSKSAKRFMSPTISAASKAVAVAAAPSPRRKILGERNEDVVLQPSLHSPVSDAVSLKNPAVVASKDSTCRELRPGHELGFGSQDAPYCCCGECGEQMEEEDAKIKNHQPGAIRTFRISPAYNAPVGADRHLPPYDPDTNYLSPRPRFLHYRPNPRIEQYLHGEREFLVMEDGKRLDDCFSDESCEDSSDCAREVQSSYLGEEFEEEESSVDFSSQSPSVVAAASGDNAGGLVRGPTAEAGGNVQSFSGLKFAPFLLVLILVCLIPFFFWGVRVISSASPSPLMKAPVLQVIDDLRIRDYLAVSALNLKEITYKLKHFSSNTFGSHSTVATLPEIGPPYVDNFTAPAMERRDQGRLGTDISQTCLEDERSGEDEIKPMIKAEVSGNVFEDVGDVEAETPEVEVENYTLHEIGKMEDLSGEADQNDSSPEAESLLTEGYPLEHDNEQMIQVKDVCSTGSKGTKLEDDIAQFGQERGLPPDVCTDHEVVVGTGQEYGTGMFPPQIQLSDSDEVYSESVSEALDSQGFSSHASDANPWAKLALGVSSTLVLLAARAGAAVFLSRKQKQQSQAVLNPKSPAQETNEVDTSASAYHIPVDPCESSSNMMESSSIGPREGGGEEEEQDGSSSLERRRRTRRDSLTLSSPTTSYGSFTAYEKVSAKKGAKANNNEAMTPVRRSSRIKNQVTTS